MVLSSLNLCFSIYQIDLKKKTDLQNFQIDLEIPYLNHSGSLIFQ